MANGDSVRVNGLVFGWESIVFRIDDLTWTGITGIDYGDKVEKAYQYGAGKHHAPIGITRGKYDPGTVVITARKATARDIKARIASRAGTGGMSNVPVPMYLSFEEPTDGTPIVVEIAQMFLTEHASSHSEGTDPLDEKLTFMPMGLKHNGATLYDSSEAGAP
jgi:hypothetical protein